MALVLNGSLMCAEGAGFAADMGNMMNPSQWMGGNRNRGYESENDQRIREADGYRLKRINEAEGDVARFSALLCWRITARHRRSPAAASISGSSSKRA